MQEYLKNTKYFAIFRKYAIGIFIKHITVSLLVIVYSKPRSIFRNLIYSAINNVLRRLTNVF